MNSKVNMDIERLLEIVKMKAPQNGEFVLASGGKATRYFDLKMVLLDPEGAALTGNKMFELIAEEEIEAVGGYGLGANLIIGTIVVASYLRGKPIAGFEVTEGDIIKGHLPPTIRGKVAIVDDVISTGGTIFKAIEILEQKGYRVAKIGVILDRGLGGSKELQRRGYNFGAILRADIMSGKIYLND